MRVYTDVIAAYADDEIIAAANEVVKKVLERKEGNVSDNLLVELAGDNIVFGKVKRILEDEYNAKRYVPYDGHCCGGYDFDNPLLTEEERKTSYYCCMSKWDKDESQDNRTVIRPEEFAQKMKQIFKKGYDEEVAHVEADDLMGEVLSSLGYEDGIKVFNSNEKWYA